MRLEEGQGSMLGMGRHDFSLLLSFRLVCRLDVRYLEALGGGVIKDLRLGGDDCV